MGVHPPLLYPAYAGTVRRAPRHAPIEVPWTRSEATGPAFPPAMVRPSEADLTRQHGGTPLGERIVVTGRVLDESGRPARRTLVEVWQANAAGRYAHAEDRHDAPLDPNFTGTGRVLTDDEGRYRIVTIKPGAYPWRNHANAWRPAHVHFSVFGPAFATRLVTQMYFPGDPLLPLDPIFGSVPGDARARLVSAFDLESTVPAWALGYRFDIVLGGSGATPMEG